MNDMATGRFGSGNILRSLFGRIDGSGPGDGDMRHAEAAGHAARATGSLATEARREVLEKISALFVDNELDLTPANLLAAHAAFSGSDFRLARHFAARQIAGETIDQAWLDSVVEEDAANAERDKLDALMARLESSVGVFRESTQSAHLAAADYGSELKAHVERMDGTDPTELVLTNLADIARAMLERTREIEMKMKRSEQEAIALRRSLDRAQRSAEIDYLTKLPNRRAFEKLFEREFRTAQKQVEPLSVAFCDIDKFKRINDSYGHETGDRVIQVVAQVFSRISNEKCHVARHGGEEFVMLFRGMDVNAARDLLDQARAALADRRFRSRMTDDMIGSVTFSGGVADVFAYKEPRTALRAADEALYVAKESGRNRIELAVPGT